MLGYKANIHWLPYHYGSSRLTMKCDYAICINIEVQLFHKADHNQTTAMIKKNQWNISSNIWSTN